MKDKLVDLLIEKQMATASSVLSKSSLGDAQLRLIEQLLIWREVSDAPDNEIPHLHTLIQYGCDKATRAKVMSFIQAELKVDPRNTAAKT